MFYEPEFSIAVKSHTVLGMAILILVLFVNALFGGDNGNINIVHEYGKQIIKREKSYVNREYILRVVSNLYPDKKLESDYHDESREMEQIYKIMESPSDWQSSAPWYSWEIYVKKIIENDPVYFKAYNGKESRLFLHTEDEIYTKPNNGRILPYDIPQENTACLLTSFLFSDVGESFVAVDSNVQFVEKTSLNGKSVTLFRSQHGDNILSYYISDAPEYIILKMSFTSTSDKNVHIEWNVENVEKINGVYFPMKGSYTANKIGVFKAAKGEYEIQEIKQLTELDRKTFFPKWPKGTGIVNHITGKQEWIEPDHKLMEKKALNALEKRQNNSTTSRRNVVLIVVNSIFILLIIYYVYNKRKTLHKGNER